MEEILRKSYTILCHFINLIYISAANPIENNRIRKRCKKVCEKIELFDNLGAILSRL